LKKEISKYLIDQRERRGNQELIDKFYEEQAKQKSEAFSAWFEKEKKLEQRFLKSQNCFSDRNIRLKELRKKCDGMRSFIMKELQQKASPIKVKINSKLSFNQYEEVQKYIEEKKRKIRKELNNRVLIGTDTRAGFSKFYSNRQAANFKPDYTFKAKNTSELRKKILGYNKHFQDEEDAYEQFHDNQLASNLNFMII